MICPNCGAEYVPGMTECFDCRVDLVEARREPEPGVSTPKPFSPGSSAFPAPRTDPPERFSMVTAFTSSDPGLMALAKSLLQSAQIPYVADGEAIQDLFGLGRLSGFNPITGPAALRVAPQDADDAAALLADLGECGAVECDGDEGDVFEDDTSEGEGGSAGPGLL